ncbi:hypothetical protein DTO027B9_1999 [Paecilomyces variotii]|nr:hypothetical protein DTO027B9_1999 [Paecilomyces variotii]
MAQTAEESSTTGQAGLSCSCCSGPSQPQENQTVLEDNQQDGRNNDKTASDDGESVDRCCKDDAQKECAASVQFTADQDCSPYSDQKAEPCCAPGPADRCLDTEDNLCKSSVAAGKDKCQNGCCDKNDSDGFSLAGNECDEDAGCTDCCDTNEPRCKTAQPTDLCQTNCGQPSEKPRTCKAIPSGCCALTNNQQWDQDSSCAREQVEDGNCCSKIQESIPHAASTLDVCCTSSDNCECSGMVLFNRYERCTTGFKRLANFALDECIAEYAAKLCADESIVGPEGGCSNEIADNNTRRSTCVQPCNKHLEMAAAFTTSMQDEPRESRVEAAEAQYVTNISRLIRKCFCSGPRPFIFPGGRTCCAVRGSRMRSVPASKSSLKPTRAQQPAVKTTEKPAPVSVTRMSDSDVEKASEGNKYSVILGVVGMTCTGCESKLHNVLESYSGVSDVKTSFILNRAELVYDPSMVADVSCLTSYVKRRTGFTCTILRTSLAGTVDGENFTLTNLDPKAAERIRALNGVNSVVPVGKEDHQVFYEPRMIGIRDILEIVTSHGNQVKLPAKSSEETAKRIENRHWHSLIAQTLSAAILTVPILVFAWSSFAREAPPSEKIQYSVISVALATAVQMLAIPIYKHAFQTLGYQKEIDMDVLVVLSITSAYVYSLVALGFEVRHGGSTNILGRPVFETSSLLITLIKFGRLLTLWIRRKARDIQRTDSSQSQMARVIKKVSLSRNSMRPSLNNDQEELLDTALLHYGDIIQSRAGEQIVTDGVVVNGIAEIDESQITGEIEPVTRSKKSQVFAGSKIVNGTIEYRVTRLVSENILSIVKNLVTSATSSRTKTQERADLLASYLTPTILAAAVIDFLIWVLVDVFVEKRPGTSASINALTFAISVLAISCPCALALAVPTILTVASFVGVNKGVIFKSGAALHAGDKINHAVFDKTGTLTTEKLAVLKELYPRTVPNLPESEVRLITAMVTQGNKHPVSQAVYEHLENKISISDKVKLPSPAKVIIGKGVELATEDGLLRGGSPAWLGLKEHPAVKEMINSTLTVFCLTKNDTLLALYGLSGNIRPEALEVLGQLRGKKITIHLLSGDNGPSVSRVASSLGFDPQNVHSNCQPEDKATYIRKLQRSDPKTKVCFIGDGTNDAPALSQADLGICMSNAAGIAVDAADVGILKDSLHGLLLFLDLSRRATCRIRLNLAWAVIYNIFAVLLAAGVFEAVGFRIQPSYAGVGEMVSLLPIIGISLSLRIWL